jgi:hypothetical protein
MITPIKKPAHRDMLDWEQKFNRGINSIRGTYSAGCGCGW